MVEIVLVYNTSSLLIKQAELQCPHESCSLDGKLFSYSIYKTNTENPTQATFMVAAF